MKPIDKRRIEESLVLMDQGLSNDDRWYIHSILAQCFLPYRNPNTERWVRTNGQYGITVQSGVVPQPSTVEGIVAPGIPYGAKPRLINCYAQTYAIRQKTPVIPIERSMSAFMRSLGFKVTGGKHGTISRFQDQTIRLAASKWTVWGPSQDGRGITQFNAEPYRRIDLWFPTNPNQETLWPSEVELTQEFFESLLEHAIPYDYRALSLLRSHARAQDVYLWLTQRLHRIPKKNPLDLGSEALYPMFGGGIREPRMFPGKFAESLRLALLAYPEAKVEDLGDGQYRFKHSSPPIAKTQIGPLQINSA